MGEAQIAKELPEAKRAETMAEPTSAPSSTASPSDVPMAPLAAMPATIRVVAVPLPRMAVAMAPARNAEPRFPRRTSMKCFRRSPQARRTPVRTMRTPQSRRATPPSRLMITSVPGFNSVQLGHGKDHVFTLVKNFMASITPSFTPLPESLIPPKGDISIR